LWQETFPPINKLFFLDKERSKPEEANQPLPFRARCVRAQPIPRFTFFGRRRPCRAIEFGIRYIPPVPSCTRACERRGPIQKSVHSDPGQRPTTYGAPTRPPRHTWRRTCRAGSASRCPPLGQEHANATTNGTGRARAPPPPADIPAATLRAPEQQTPAQPRLVRPPRSHRRRRSIDSSPVVSELVTGC
jgi:hypothetical protein